MMNADNQKKVLLLELLPGALAYLLALMIRYRLHMDTWMIQFYGSLFFITLLIVYFSCRLAGRGKRYRKPGSEDPGEILADVIKITVLQVVLFLLFLFITKQAERISRLLLGIYFLFWVCFSLAVRLVYRKQVQRIQPNGEAARMLIVTHPGMEQQAIALLSNREIGNVYTTLKPQVLLIDAGAEKTDIGETVRQFDCAEAFLYLPQSTEEVSGMITRQAEEAGVSCNLSLQSGAGPVGHGNLRRTGRIVSRHLPSFKETCNIMGVRFHVTNPEETAAYLKTHTDNEQLSGQYVTFCNVHTTVMAKEDEGYRKIQNNAALTLPDGAPIADKQRKAGFDYAERTAGPDVMDALFALTMDGSRRHFFIGSTEETLHKLQNKLLDRYPGLRIAGVISPPFREITAEEDAAIVKQIRAAQADFIWVGLGAPKQEQWMAAHKGCFSGVMLGVGAGFDFFAGTVKRAPIWMQRLSLEWLYRLLQDPARLWKRYVVTNLKFLLFSGR